MFLLPNSRLGGELEDLENDVEALYSIGDEAVLNELEESNLYKLDSIVDDSDLDIEKNLADVNDRFTKVAYSDASFAVGETKQQTVHIWFCCYDQWCANIMGIPQANSNRQKTWYNFLISHVLSRTGCTPIHKHALVRHLEIRYHLVRCVVLSGVREL
jgi:hypothetical protein